MGTSTDTISEKVSVSVKMAYGAGDFGANLVFQTVMLYMMYFFTDVFLIGAATAGLISFASKLWDGITDPLMGFISDRTRTRWGSKRPYLLFGSIPLGVLFFLLFFSPEMPESGRVIYALILFLLLNTAYTVVNIPYGALTADITLSSKERSSITGYRMFFAIVATLFVAGATKPLSGMFEKEAVGFRFVAGIYALLAIGFTLVTFFFVKEKYGSDRQKSDSFSLSEVATIIKNNRPFIHLSLGTVFHLAAVSLIASMVNYYFKYNMQREDFIPVAFLSLLGAAVLSLPLWVYISNKAGKKTAFNLGMSLLGSALVPLYFVESFNIALFVPVLIVAGVGMSTIYLSPWSMIPDTVEYSQHKTGLRREGILYGFFYFGQKLAAGLALLVSGFGLDLFGYVQPSTGGAALQSAEATEGILVLTTLVPIFFIIIGAFFISRYSITGNMHRNMVEELQSKNGA